MTFKIKDQSENISGSEKLIFGFLGICSILWLAVVRHKPLIFPFRPGSISLPIWLALHSPAHISQHHAFSLLVICWGRWIWNKVSLFFNTSLFSTLLFCDTQTFSSSQRQSSHHRGQLTSCLLRAGKQSTGVISSPQLGLSSQTPEWNDPSEGTQHTDMLCVCVYMCCPSVGNLTFWSWVNWLLTGWQFTTGNKKSADEHGKFVAVLSR